MKPKFWTVLERRTIAEGRFVGLENRKYVKSDGSVGDYEVAVRTNVRAIVAGLPVTDKGEYVLLKQFRVPLGRDVIETPAGLVDPGETPMQAMVRELREETGYFSEDIRSSFSVPTSAGLTNEMIECFVCLGAKKVGEAAPEASEMVTTILVPDAEFDDFLLRKHLWGFPVDPKVPMMVDYYRKWVARKLG